MIIPEENMQSILNEIEGITIIPIREFESAIKIALIHRFEEESPLKTSLEAMDKKSV